jgi:hypothetical protein
MKLWIDDTREPPDKTWVWVKTSEEARRILHHQSVDFIAFDHDLGGEDTTYPIALLIERRAQRGIAPPGWSVHSANPVGAARLRVALQSAESWWKAYVKNSTLRA